ncbi:MAG TPA: tetratricopeptide repeat protein [Pyrinomonadaceae bacterium]|jgi:tetratricopeptide (TPR) repeat protein|nr:tetratricopeptide repeat protein [Pyrinomonadaceae bacterium]
MKIKKKISILCVLLIFASLFAGATFAQKKTGKGARAAQPTAKSSGAKKGDDAAKDELEALLKLPVAERVERLRAYLAADPPASLKARATEQLVSAHAALGDERLQAGDAAGGIELFKQAVALAPADMSDKLYYEVVSQLPANLFLRGQTAAALELTHAIEPQASTDAKRLLTLAAFYVSVEQAEEAARLARAAITLLPDLAPAHQALGAAHRLALRLDEATAEYARAVELDPRSVPARHSLADLRRATGKPEDALALYRELLAADAKNLSARNGMVLALFDAGKREDAERELEAALTDEPRNLPLLVGAAYWYAAHAEWPRAMALAEQAVRIEPRYTWAQVALARSLIANKMPLEAERALRFARQYGRFPTLDYELANALVAAGLYNEAFEELARGFTLKDGQLETQLAGRTPARAESFIELLAPERRASIFQSNAADTEANARIIKGLLALNLSLATTTGEGSAGAMTPAGDAAIAAATNDFTSGADEMRAFRQLYAASRLLRHSVADGRVLELMDAARQGIEAAIDAPAATVATTADELREARAGAIAQGGTPDIPSLPRNAISNILRGRIEELTGMALLGQGKTTEAVAALRRAVSVLPDKSLYWRMAQWRLGTALASNGQERDALAAYIKSYNPQSPDPARRAVIESLYKKVNGSPAGLDAQIGTVPEARATTFETTNANTPTTLSTPAPTETPAVVTPTPEPSPLSTPDAPVVSTPTPEPSASPTPQPTATTANDPAPQETPLATPTPDASPEATPVTTSPVTTTSSVEPTPTPIQSNAHADAGARGEVTAVKVSQNGCAFMLSAGKLELTNGGGSVSVVASLEGNANLAGISAATTSWSDIIVLREPQGSADTNSLKFTITSISKTTGTFTVNFKSPCGAQELSVAVK